MEAAGSEAVVGECFWEDNEPMIEILKSLMEALTVLPPEEPGKEKKIQWKLLWACEDCERCRWDPESDCGIPQHPHCVICGHCMGRHANQDDKMQFVIFDSA